VVLLLDTFDDPNCHGPLWSDIHRIETMRFSNPWSPIVDDNSVEFFLRKKMRSVREYTRPYNLCVRGVYLGGLGKLLDQLFINMADINPARDRNFSV
jgi:hypothetical protein